MPSLKSLALIAAVLLGACGGSEPAPSVGVAPAPVRHTPCDDGGSGGVMIDGVCL